MCGCLHRRNSQQERGQQKWQASANEETATCWWCPWGYDPEGHRRKPQQKTVHPPEGLTPKAKEKWLEEEAALFERECKNEPLPVDKSITLAAYTAYWLAHIAPGKLAKSTLARDKQGH